MESLILFVMSHGSIILLATPLLLIFIILIYGCIKYFTLNNISTERKEFLKKWITYFGVVFNICVSLFLTVIEQPTILLDCLSDTSRMNIYIMYAENHILPYEILDSLSTEELRLLRNGIYAYEGRIFNENELTDYYYNYNWYNPTIAPGELDWDTFTTEQQDNIMKIKNLESTYSK